EIMKHHVKKTFTQDVLTGLGSFGSLYSIKNIINNYDDPVLVQSIDGVGTNTKVAVMCGKFENLGYDLFSAATHDIVVMGAKPITVLDYV
ncbi:AIR synthase related protein, partial [Francisella tularensis]|uniref:AIR synthase related protein n=1 Tax=Francisella tularensis TaxID=263 RepID=UPI00238197B4